VSRIHEDNDLDATPLADRKIKHRLIKLHSLIKLWLRWCCARLLLRYHKKSYITIRDVAVQIFKKFAAEW